MRERILRAELWDQMHYFLRCHNDHMTHYCLEYKGNIDIDLLTRSLQLILDANPVLHSRFVASPLRPFWRVTDADASDVISVFDTETPDEDVIRFFLSPIPLDSPVQIRIAVFRCGERQLMAMLINHMCFDGGGGRTFLTTLCNNYNALAEGREPEIVHSGSRSFTKIYDDLPLRERLHAKLLFRYTANNADSPVFPLSPSDDSDRAMMIVRRFDENIISGIRAYAAKNGATSNDLLIAAIISVLYDMCNYDRGKPMSVFCAYDMRRYMKDKGLSAGLTNHVAWLECSSNNGTDDFPKLLQSVKTSMDAGKADKYTGMYALPLLNLGCRVVPLCITDKIVPHVYNNPNIEISNVGHVKSDDFSFCTARLITGHLTGSIKKKPMLFLSITRFDHELVFSTALYGNKSDADQINRFLDNLSALFDALD